MQLCMWSWMSSTNLHRFRITVVAIMKFHISWSCKYYRNRPSPLCAALSLQCSVASCATLWVLSCLYSTVSFFVFHRYTFLLRPWSSTWLTATELKRTLAAWVLVSWVWIPIIQRYFFPSFCIFLSHVSRVIASVWPRPRNLTENGVLKPIMKVMKAGNDYHFSANYRDWRLHSEWILNI
jgi:hypothetical protein